MSVHDIDMDPVGPGGVDRAYLITKAREVRGQDRGRDEQGTTRHG